MNEAGVYDVCDLLGLRSGSPHGGSRGDQLSIACPLAPSRHNDPTDYNLSCSVSVSNDSPSLAKCFSFNCGFKGSFYRMLEEAVRIRGNPPEMVAFLKTLAPTERFTLEASLARSKKQFEESVSHSRHPIIHDKDRDILPESRIDRFRTGVPKYAINRGFTVETCKTWTLGYDKQRKRLVFPIRRYDGKLVGLTGRDITGCAETKYHNYAGLDKTKYLFGEHMLESKAPLIICEGQFDAIITWQHLGITAVATLGEGFSQHHVRKITAYEPSVVYIFPDNDGPGHLAAEKIEYGLRGRMLLKLMLPPEGMDPGDLMKEEAEVALKQAISIPMGIRWDDIQA